MRMCGSGDPHDSRSGERRYTIVMEMSGDRLRERLREDGVVLVREFFERRMLARLREAADRCFAAIEGGASVSGNYRYSREAHSVGLPALKDFGVDGDTELMAPLLGDGLGVMFSDLVGERWRCRLEHCWVRKKFAPRNAPATGYHLQDWHQDGALGARFPLAPGQEITATGLATCWIPLDACGRSSPGLEFIRNVRPGLLHFTELKDAALRERFDAAAFWAPELEFGDGLVFRNDVLHRTQVNGDMRGDRMSVEYRIFPDNS